VPAEPWTRDEASASGQVFEFRVWAALTEQSRGSLHVFLPLTDRGVDGLVHRLTDGTYIAVQAATTYFVVLAWVRAENRFHEECLVIPSKELASIAGRDAYGHIKFEFHPGATTPGRPAKFRTPTSSLATVVATMLSSEKPMG
jgi:hypothetical protein